MKKQELSVKRISPPIGVEGGIVSIECTGFQVSSPEGACGQVKFDSLEGEIVSASAELILVKIPAGAKQGTVSLALNGKTSRPHEFKLIAKFASELHPVSNPAVDSSGNIYTTFSGTRGEKVPFSVYKITPRGEKQPYPIDILNPTGLTFDAQGNLYVSSRYDGTIYRITKDNHIEEYVANLGIATGIAFDASADLFVGDRNGKIYRIDAERRVVEFATLEPSVSAYHLTFGPERKLYVAGPTLSTQDSIYEISSDGKVNVFFSGIGRPQGLAFDEHENLYVGGSYKGKRGILRISPDKKIDHFISAPVPVGLAFDPEGCLVIADTQSIYRGFVGIKPLR